MDEAHTARNDDIEVYSTARGVREFMAIATSSYGQGIVEGRTTM